MIRLKKISLIILFLILTSCSFGRPEDMTELIESPKQEETILKGTWKVTEIRKIGKNNSLNINKNDKLYIDNDIVALNDDYAFPPKFSSKFVNLKSYLESRSIEFNDSSDKYVKILTASQGQLYSKDFIILNNKKILFIQDEYAITLKKVNKSVPRSIVEKCAKKASKERTTKNGEKVEKDTTVLIGVREKIETDANNPKYYYYTYCIRLEPNKMARIEKSEHIFFPHKQEFWRLRCETDINSKNYNNIEAYPIKLEKEINKKDNKKRYSLENNKINLKINFVNENFISFDYNLINDKLPITKYAVVKTDDLKSNSFLNITDFTGNKDSEKLFKGLIYDQVSNNLSTKKENLTYDYTNFGLIRNFGLWQLQSSYNIENDKSLEQKSFPIDMAYNNSFISQNNKDITVDQIKNINNQAKDYFELVNGQYVAVQSPDEILFYSIKNGLIDPNPKFSIKLNNSTQIVMFEQGLGSYAEKWEKSFNENNIIIH